MFKRIALITLLAGLIAGCKPTPPLAVEPAKEIEPPKQEQAEEKETQEKALEPIVVEEVIEKPVEASKKEQLVAERNSVMIVIKTSKGDIKLELDKEKAPKTVENFMKYVNSGHYNGVIFHRVIENFMIQGGGFDENMNQKAAPHTVENEADNGLANDVGTIAMARTSDPHSGGAQFFINVKDNDFLNHTAKTSQGWGYCVFGKVIEGMDVANEIKGVSTGGQDVPNEPIIISEISVIEE